jgi:hypothetical protein
VAVSATCFAQGNLQFNQVLNFNYSTTIGTPGGSVVVETLTVPEDKVWKITSASGNHTGYTQGVAFRIDNHTLHTYAGGFTHNVPYWLSEGDHDVSFKTTSTFLNTSCIGSLSIIEFNVITE